MWTGEERVQSGRYAGSRWDMVPKQYLGVFLYHQRDNTTWPDVISARKEVQRRTLEMLKTYRHMWKFDDFKKEWSSLYRYPELLDFIEQPTLSESGHIRDEVVAKEL